MPCLLRVYVSKIHIAFRSILSSFLMCPVCVFFLSFNLVWLNSPSILLWMNAFSPQKSSPHCSPCWKRSQMLIGVCAYDWISPSHSYTRLNEPVVKCIEICSIFKWEKCIRSTTMLISSRLLFGRWAQTDDLIPCFPCEIDCDARLSWFIKKFMHLGFSIVHHSYISNL